MLNVIDYSWHIAHAHRLMALTGLWRIHYHDPARKRFWRHSYRPLPAAFGGWVETVEPERYDLAILHLDNWCADWGLRAMPYRHLDALIGDRIPKVVIMHGRPNDGRNWYAMRTLLGDDKWLVCNSYEAQREWDYPRSAAIWHGYDVEEWPDPDWTGEPYAVAVCSGGEMSNLYHGLPVIRRLRRDLPGRVLWLGDRGDRVARSFGDYKALLSRARCYVHTTQWAPMSGSRTEAMLCGVPVVTTAYDDEHLFLRHMENGVIANTYSEMRDAVKALLGDVDLCRRIGEAGRETARRLFNRERYERDWRAFLVDQVGLEV